MKNKEELEKRLSELEEILKQTYNERMGYADKQIKINSLKCKIELLEWILS